MKQASKSFSVVKKNSPSIKPPEAAFIAGIESKDIPRPVKIPNNIKNKDSNKTIIKI
jgi:hypothetical protein